MGGVFKFESNLGYHSKTSRAKMGLCSSAPVAESVTDRIHHWDAPLNSSYRLWDGAILFPNFKEHVRDGITIPAFSLVVRPPFGCPGKPKIFECGSVDQMKVVRLELLQADVDRSMALAFNHKRRGFYLHGLAPHA